MYRYFVLNLLLKLRLCRYLFIKFKMAALNPCDFAVARQTFFERRATNFLGSTTIKIGSNYQNKLEASTRKVGNIYQKSWKHLPENLVATIFVGSTPILATNCCVGRGVSPRILQYIIIYICI